MKRFSRWLAYTIATVWAGLTFLASNSPTEVEQRANGWLALSIVHGIPTKVVIFAEKPAVFALTFFVLGSFAGWWIKSWLTERNTLPWWDSLGEEFSLLAYRIDRAQWSNDLTTLNADIEVMRVKASERGFPYPKFTDGFKTVQSLLPYLTRVSAHLKAGQLGQANDAAKQLSRMPPSPDGWD